MIKICISVTSHALDPPPPVTNCHTFSDPLPPRAWRTLWTAPKTAAHHSANPLWRSCLSLSRHPSHYSSQVSPVDPYSSLLHIFRMLCRLNFAVLLFIHHHGKSPTIMFLRLSGSYINSIFHLKLKCHFFKNAYSGALQLAFDLGVVLQVHPRNKCITVIKM